MHIVKNFDTFEEGIKELTTLAPAVKTYVGDEFTDTAVIDKLLTIVKSEIPTVYNPGYPGTYGITVNAREVGFKTKDFLAFGWRSIIEADKITYGFRITITEKNRFAKKTKMQETLVENGWNVLPDRRKPATPNIAKH